MNQQEIDKLIDWAETVEPTNGIVLTKALWTGRSALKFGQHKIIIPSHLHHTVMQSQPFTLAVVLTTGTGYREMSDGTWKGSMLKPGDIIIAKQFVAFEVVIEGNAVNYMPENMILATVEDFDLEKFKEQLVH